jgi:hypothetical protein
MTAAHYFALRTASYISIDKKRKTAKLSLLGYLERAGRVRRFGHSL